MNQANLRTELQIHFAGALNVRCRKFRHRVVLDINTTLYNKLARIFNLRGRFDENTRLLTHLKLIAMAQYPDNYKVSLKSIAFRVIKPKTTTFLGEEFVSCPKLVVRYVRVWEMNHV